MGVGDLSCLFLGRERDLAREIHKKNAEQDGSGACVGHPGDHVCLNEGADGSGSIATDAKRDEKAEQSSSAHKKARQKAEPFKGADRIPFYDDD